VAELITGPAAALSLLAGFQRLDPGDLLLTGTPGGTALQAPPVVVAKVGDLLPTPLKWRVFFSRQERNPAYLTAGDVITTSIASQDGGTRPRDPTHGGPGTAELSTPRDAGQAVDPTGASVDTEA
jgi:2-keto-4-pentenoate hydratase/2-oxohepta-3-ene-1,7-dioic acid hydratase in catechol pathway